MESSSSFVLFSMCGVPRVVIYPRMMKECYSQAVLNNSTGLFTRIAALFIREADTDTGLGKHYLADVICDGGARMLSIVCDNQYIPV